MKFADAPDVLTVAEAARLARVGRNAMYGAVQRGDVWSARIGNSIRIPRSALAAYLHLTNEAPGRVKPDALEVGHGNDRTAAARS